MRLADEPPEPEPSESGPLEPGAGEFEQFWERHHEAVLNAVWAMTRDLELARDARIEAFARAYVNWERIERRTPGEQRAWLIVVARNWARSELRKAHREAAKAQRAIEQFDTDVEDVEAAAELRRAIESLPQRQQEVIVMFYLADLSDSEISRALDISPTAVSSSKHRGLRALRRLLGGQEGGGRNGR